MMEKCLNNNSLNFFPVVYFTFLRVNCLIDEVAFRDLEKNFFAKKWRKCYFIRSSIILTQFICVSLFFLFFVKLLVNSVSFPQK